MEVIIYIISPLTKEIIPYKIFLDDRFSVIIDDLQTKHKPSNLIFYNGLELKIINPSDLISLYYPSSLQFVILAYDQKINSLPILSIPKDKILLLILRSNLSQLIPFLTDHLETIRSINNQLQSKFNSPLSLARLHDGRILDIFGDNQRIGEVISERGQEPILLLISNSLEKLSSLELLPNEVILDTLLKLPLTDILRACQGSRKLSTFCQDNSVLWRRLLVRDFGLQGTLEGKSSRETYRQVSEMSPHEILVLGLGLGGIIGSSL